ncbi:hypothetical protein SPHN_09780 [Sphingomonas faeni]|nr:hypothetical protein [Sphingomonas faeni]
MPKTAPKPQPDSVPVTFDAPWTWCTPLATVEFQAGVPVTLDALARYGDIHSAAAAQASHDGP